MGRILVDRHCHSKYPSNIIIKFSSQLRGTESDDMTEYHLQYTNKLQLLVQWIAVSVNIFCTIMNYCFHQ